jgi:predicted dehydrogenase
LANGDRSFSKERIEVFGGRSSAVLEDFRRLEMVRNGHIRKTTSFWRQDKGHRAEWAAFCAAVLEHKSAPIPFEEIVCSTLATIRADESIATGRPLPVDAVAFIQAARSPDKELH